MDLYLDTIDMTISSTTFTTIYAGYTTTGSPSYGGVIYVTKAKQLTLSSITATDIEAAQTTTSDGGGRFIFVM